MQINLNAERRRSHFDELGSIGYNGQSKGITRLPYTAEERAAMALVKGYMEQAGLITRFDQFGNLFGRRDGKDKNAPVVMTGSHIDTVVNGGKFDGTVGTLSAIEALQAFNENGIIHTHPIEVAVFVSEESARFGGGTLGSNAFVGNYSRADLDRLKDKEGITLARAIRDAGFDPDKLDTVKANPKDIKCFVELHIEQSVILETRSIPIGVVDQIAAPTNMRLTIKGRAGHAGATPMDLRRDAFMAAAEIALEIERIANTIGKETVGTVGEVMVSPNTINVIPGEVMLGIDIRDVTTARKDQAVAQLEDAIARIASRRKVVYDTDLIARQEPVKTAPNIVELIGHTCDRLGLPHINITSGAYHDALNMAKITDIGMIFVPSINGISHAPDEYTPFEDILNGARVLTEVLHELAK
jgi:allantoate deiminase